MNAITGVTVRFTVNDVNAIADLERNAVAVVVAGRAPANGDVTHAIHVNCSSAAAVNVVVLSPVSVHDEVFKHDVGGIDGTQNREMC